ncbi:hypothetical protein Ciccas_013772 [Cichlidogyrus casuarinus]|uniref:Uncharacterized protein n=1 Tax=Cichlidogyrus casuarinus TaxID=1844966 RepID=A0ABD2PJU0_9PLAT
MSKDQILEVLLNLKISEDWTPFLKSLEPQDSYNTNLEKLNKDYKEVYKRDPTPEEVEQLMTQTSKYVYWSLTIPYFQQFAQICLFKLEEPSKFTFIQNLAGRAIPVLNSCLYGNWLKVFLVMELLLYNFAVKNTNRVQTAVKIADLTKLCGAKRTYKGSTVNLIHYMLVKSQNPQNVELKEAIEALEIVDTIRNRMQLLLGFSFPN